MEKLLSDSPMLLEHIRTRLSRQAGGNHFFIRKKDNENPPAAVLFLLGMHRLVPGEPPAPCFIFTQRSRHVCQPGDLCFPGGGVSPCLDRLLAGFLKLPGLPLFPRASFNGRGPRAEARLLATSLRESYEEMRLNPFRITFLGPMAPEFFGLFNRTIYPMVAWTRGQRRFVLNREVERIVHIPLRHFLHHSAYGRFRLERRSRKNAGAVSSPMPDQPCITYQNGGIRDLLWGVTYRIVMRFLDTVFDFRPPDTQLLPVVSKQPGENKP